MAGRNNNGNGRQNRPRSSERENATSIPGWLRALVPGSESAEDVKQKSPRELDRIRREVSSGKRRSGSRR